MHSSRLRAMLRIASGRRTFWPWYAFVNGPKGIRALEWSKSRKLRNGEYEEKYDPGTVLRNGRVVPVARPDSLAARAALAEQEWLAEREKKRKPQRARRRAREQAADENRANAGEDDFGSSSGSANDRVYSFSVRAHVEAA